MLTMRHVEESTFLRDASMKEQYDSDEEALPIRYYDKHFYFVDWHWHEEVEFTIIECDELLVGIDSEQLLLKRGDCLMINSRVLHRYAPVEDYAEESLWDSLLFHPKVIAELDSPVYRDYIEPILQSSVKYLILDPEAEWQREVIRYLNEAKKYCIENPPTVDLRLKHAITGLWIPLAEHKNLFEQNGKKIQGQNRQERLRLMMRFIWEHYEEPITLADIAEAAHIGERTAERCFRDEIQTSPLLYLQSYRLRCAREMLLSTEDSILDIALACGFESSSYFDRIFKRAFHVTPRQFRKEK